MTNLITEARELCKYSEKIVNQLHTERLDYELEYMPLIETTQVTSELCDALEKANAEIDRLSQLAMMRDSEIGDKDREIERLREAQRWRELEEEPCGDIGQKTLLYGIGGVDVGEYLGEGDWNVEYRVVPGETFTHWMPLPTPPEEGAEHDED